MNLSKTQLAEELAKSLQRDVGSFAARLKCHTSDLNSFLQSSLLVDCEYTPTTCETGEILMKELLHPCSADVTVKVGEERFLCHKEVLSSRCEYFSAMLQNQWSECESQEVTLNDIRAEAAAAFLRFLYGGFVEIPKFCPVLDLLQISDMYGVKDLMNVVKFHIKTEMCHSFHRPCKECITKAPEVIQLATIFSLLDLLDALMKWNVKYFSKLWPTKGFASLQEDVRQKCVRSVVDSLTFENAIQLLKESDKLLSGITRVQWTKPVVDMGTELMTSCCDFIAANILRLTLRKTIVELFEGMGWKADIVERILLQIGDGLSIENVCNAYIAVNKLLYLSSKEEWIEEFPKMLMQLKKKARNFLVSNYYAVIHTESWQLVPASDKMELKSEALCYGDETKKLSKRPVLSSSIHKKPPTPSVLKKQGMKVKPRETKKDKIQQKRRAVPAKEVLHASAEPPMPKPLISVQEFVPGTWFFDVAVGPQLLSQN